jgi:hypothetical protein
VGKSSIIKTIIGLALCCGNDLWVFRETERIVLNASERQIWRRITGIVKVGGHFGMRYGNDWYQVQKESELSTVIYGC